ncbi:hypothetical protein TNCT_403331 [Trichonephila clavata]|uniref:Uncharacterized protein n=1 Tax=Trichonephila clavata TaxID=2740835 RepID=A0A8X6HBN4_TRICU|nr:hypothetical protein TNCT_403331 [Trichonephila clavata]
MDPLRNKETLQDAHSKSPYTKAGPLRIKCPDLISRATFQPSRRGPIYYSTKLCFNLSLDNRGPFQDNNAVFKSLDTMELVSNSACLHSTIQCSTCPWTADTFAEQKMHPSQKTVV